MIADKAQFWIMALSLGALTFLLRFSFLGMIGNRVLPPLLLKLLRYTPMAVIPGLVAPAVLWPAATGGETDPARLAAALATVGAGILTRNALAAIAAGVITLFGLPLLIG
ncbi:MAG: AzlD domain-containing protein [Gemmobacter sp.]|nr:AzlD domain-containing protein [Gemmobacter sp.]